MEATEKKEPAKISTTNGWLFKTIYIIGIILGVAIAGIAFYDGGIKIGGIMTVGLISFFLLARPAWRTGDWFRKFIAPDAYFTYGNKDAFKKRIFWLVGPQWSAISGLWIITLVFPFVLFGENLGTPRKPEKQIVSSTVATPPELSAPIASSSSPLGLEKAVDEPSTTDSTNQKTVAEVQDIQAEKTNITIEQEKTSDASSIRISSVIAPKESSSILTLMLVNATSSFKIAEYKGELEGMQKPSTGDRKAARKLNEKGLEQLQGGQFNEAAKILQKGTESDPSDVEVKNNYVYALLKDGQLELAEKVTGELLTNSPGRSSAWANLAEIYALTGRKDEGTRALILAFQFSSNKDRTLKFLRDNSTSEDSSLKDISSNAISLIEKL